jgi:hypothetical protein
MGATVHIDTGGLTAFALQLRSLVASVPLQEKEFLGSAAEVVASEARSNASGSPKVQQTIRVFWLPEREGTQAVAIGAGDKGSGNAGLYPLLREGGTGKKFKYWEHPVFGNTSVQVTQMSNPYLEPALRDKESELEAIADEVIDRELEAQLGRAFSS